MPVSTRIATMSAPVIAAPCASSTVPRSAPVEASCAHRTPPARIRVSKKRILKKDKVRRRPPNMEILLRPKLRNGRKFGETDQVVSLRPRGRCDAAHTAYVRFSERDFRSRRSRTESGPKDSEG